MIRAIQAFTLALFCAALLGCGGDNAATEQGLVDQNTQQETPRDDQPKEEEPEDDGIACADIYAPVCSAQLQNIQCITTPCPVGIHKTFPNRCESDAAKAIFLSEGECGDLEGQPYYDEKNGRRSGRLHQGIQPRLRWRSVCRTLYHIAVSGDAPQNLRQSLYGARG